MEQEKKKTGSFWAQTFILIGAILLVYTGYSVYMNEKPDEAEIADAARHEELRRIEEGANEIAREIEEIISTDFRQNDEADRLSFVYEKWLDLNNRYDELTDDEKILLKAYAEELNRIIPGIMAD